MKKRYALMLGGALALGAILLTAAAGASAAAMASAGSNDPAPILQQGPPPGPHGPGGPGGRGGPGGPGLGPLLFQLDLSAAQAEQVKTLQEQARTASQPFDEQVRKVEDELRKATAQGAFNEEALRALLASEVKPMTELRVIRAKTDAAIWKVLTADQQAALAEMMQRPPRPPRDEW